MKKRIFISIATVAAILTVGVFFACTLVNNSKEDVDSGIKVHVEKEKSGDIYDITFTTIPGMKYAIVYRLADTGPKITASATTQKIAQVVISDGVSISDNSRSILVKDENTLTANTYAYYVRYFTDTSSKKSSESDAVSGLLTSGTECVLTGTSVSVTFYYNMATGVSKVVLNNAVTFPTGFGGGDPKELRFVIGKKSSTPKLFFFSDNFAGDVISDAEECNLSTIFPEHFYDTDLVFKGLVGLYKRAGGFENEKNIYTVYYFTNLFECDVCVDGTDAKNDPVDGHDGSPIGDKPFKIPAPNAHEAINFD